MPEDSLDGDLTKTGGEEPTVADPSSDLQRRPHRRRIERLEAGLDGLCWHDSPRWISMRRSDRCGTARPDRGGSGSRDIQAHIGARRVDLAARCRRRRRPIGRTCGGAGVPQPAGGDPDGTGKRLDRIEQALAELARRLGEVEGC